ncbi:MAG: hypothetical protein JJE28_07730 [Actinomycetales bacterium]|nr:hypothetical protein [Actinomycetales bacterium]
MNKGTEVQRDVTKLALSVLGGFAFALAGSGAIREHGILDRLTRDIDLFTDNPDEIAFSTAVELLTQ